MALGTHKPRCYQDDDDDDIQHYHSPNKQLRRRSNWEIWYAAASSFLHQIVAWFILYIYIRLYMIHDMVIHVYLYM